MVELISSDSLKVVSGGFNPPPAHPFMSAALGLSSFSGLAAVGTVASAGFALGGYIADTTNIDEWMADVAWEWLNG